MIGLQNPFPVCIPFPNRWRDGDMEPDTIQFDGQTIRIRYHKRSITRGWWDSAAIHEIDWLPKCRTDKDVIAHFLSELPTSRRITKQEQRKGIVAHAKFTKCGKGTKVRLNPNMAGGLKAVGARDAIYLISNHGDAGALRVWSSPRQSYPLRSFKIGAAGDWPDFLLLTDTPLGLEVIDAT